MPVSAAIRRYYAERIFAQTTREHAPPNFTPLGVPHNGMSTVEGCRGGGKNIAEVFLVASQSSVEDIRVSCGLCNPAMYVACDVLADWARGRALDEILAVDPVSVEALFPFFDVLGGPGKPDDAREKFQYALVAVQNAVRDHRGEAPVAPPVFADPTDRNWEDPDWDDDEDGEG